MTIKQTIQAIRALGMRARWEAATREYRVSVPNGTEARAYYTPDAQDAILTATDMYARGLGAR